jgi:ABC transporter substrate binding protein
MPELGPYGSVRGARGNSRPYREHGAGSADEEEVYLSVLQKAFHDLGYVEGRNITLEHRFPAEQADRFRSMARELVESKVDVIIAVSALGAKEARQATRTIPIVVVIDPDPVGSGLIESLSHPGGNVTGLSLMAVDLSGKRLALFKEAVPNLSRVTLMIDPKDPASTNRAQTFLIAGHCPCGSRRWFCDPARAVRSATSLRDCGQPHAPAAGSIGPG